MAIAKYTVTVHEDGSITTESHAATEEVSRVATPFDIYQSSKELVFDIESQLLADRISRSVVAQMQPTDSAAEIKSKIIDALSDRGITPAVN
jgi:hypothetical protein